MYISAILVFLCVCLSAWSWYIEYSTDAQTTWPEWLIYAVFILALNRVGFWDKVSTAVPTGLVLAIAVIMTIKVSGVVTEPIKCWYRQIRYRLSMT